MITLPATYGAIELLTVEQVAALPLTEEFPDVAYAAPFPIGEGVACDMCRGRGIRVNHRFGGSSLKHVRLCLQCDGVGTITFLCAECGTRDHRGLRRPGDSNWGGGSGRKVTWHAWTCSKNHYCQDTLSDGAVCCREIKDYSRERGYCGTHIKAAIAAEQSSKIHEERRRQREEEDEIRKWQEEAFMEKVTQLRELLGIDVQPETIYSRITNRVLIDVDALLGVIEVEETDEME